MTATLKRLITGTVALTLIITAMGGTAHSSFKNLLVKKVLRKKNRQKIAIPWKMSA
jgi:hypothetical protein